MSGPQRRGLGRGLGALLGDAPLPTLPSRSELVHDIPVSRIRPNPRQPRKRFDPQTLEDLRASIAEHGVLVPILVREAGDAYELIAGERRWRACAALQLAAIPAIVRPADDVTSLEVAIVENLQRDDLNALEEAAGIAQLVDAHDYTQEQVAQRLGKSRPAIANSLRLLTLSEPIKAMLGEGLLSGAHARALLGAPEEARLELAKRIVAEGMSVRVIERVIAGLSAPARARPPGRPRSSDDRDFEDRLRVRLGTHVQLRRSTRGGTIEIRFSGEPDLIRIADLLLPEE